MLSQSSPQPRAPLIIVELEGKTVELNPSELLDVGIDLHQTFHNIGPSFALVSACYAAVKQQREVAKIKLEHQESRIYLEMRNGKFEKMYGLKKSEDAIKAAIVDDPLIQSLKEEVARLSRQVDLLWDLKQGLDNKITVMKEIGAFVRQEKRVDAKFQ